MATEGSTNISSCYLDNNNQDLPRNPLQQSNQAIMDTTRQPSKVRVVWDLPSHMPLTHMTFILKCFMPAANPVIAISDEFIRNRNNAQKEADKFLDTADTTSRLVGSTYDGLMMPPVYKRRDYTATNTWNKLLKGMEWGDMDIFNVATGKYVGNIDQPYKENYLYIMDTSETLPGYLRLTHVNSCHTGPYIIHVDDKAYFSSEKLVVDMMQNATRGFPFMMKQAIVERNGPAVTIKYINDPQQKEVDSVMGLACPVWPKQANEWCTRKRTSGWPPEELQKAIIEGGTHVVPVAHKKSKWPEVEWRFSFVLCEQKLSKSLSLAQRQCYIIMKTLLKHELSPPQLLSSYCLKNHLFWCVENIPRAVWDDTENGLSTAFLYMVDQLMFALINRNLPHYFLPINNMIAHIPDDFLHELTAKVCRLRQTPVQHILNFHKNYICCVPIELSFDKILEPVLNNSKQYHHDLTSCHKSQYLSLTSLCYGYMNECNFPAGYATCKVACDLGTRIGIIMEPIQFIEQVLLRLKTPMASMYGFEYIENVHSDLPVSFICSMACVYTTMYCRLPQDTDDPTKEQYKQKALIQFSKLLSLKKNQTGIITEYANFLRKCGHASDAIPFLLDVLQNEDDSKCYSTYGKLEASATDEHLKCEIRSLGWISAPSILFAYYQLLHCYLETGEMDKAVLLAQDFSVACHQHEEEDAFGLQLLFSYIGSQPKDDELSYNFSEPRQLQINIKSFKFSLLGYAYFDLEDYTAARDAFCEAERLNPHYKNASNNILICDAKLKI